MSLVCSLCKRELMEKGPGTGGVDNPALAPGNGILGTHGSAIYVASRLTGLVYAESRIRGISKIIRVSPIPYDKS